MRVLVFALAAVAALLVACSDPGRARHALESQGFTDIQVGDGSYPLFVGCSDSDAFGHEFTAKNGLGQPVSGVVCCGRNKGCTVRW